MGLSVTFLLRMLIRHISKRDKNWELMCGPKIKDYVALSFTVLTYVEEIVIC